MGTRVGHRPTGLPWPGSTRPSSSWQVEPRRRPQRASSGPDVPVGPRRPWWWMRVWPRRRSGSRISQRWPGVAPRPATDGRCSSSSDPPWHSRLPCGARRRASSRPSGGSQRPFTRPSCMPQGRVVLSDTRHAHPGRPGWPVSQRVIRRAAMLQPGRVGRGDGRRRRNVDEPCATAGHSPRALGRRHGGCRRRDLARRATLRGRKRRSRSAFDTAVTLESAIAAAARMGSSRIPVKG